jgi:hypothetical protein
VFIFVPIIQAIMPPLLFSSSLRSTFALRCGVAHRATNRLTGNEYEFASDAPLRLWRGDRLIEKPVGSRCASDYANLRINKARLMHDIHATSLWGQGERWGRYVSFCIQNSPFTTRKAFMTKKQFNMHLLDLYSTEF